VRKQLETEVLIVGAGSTGLSIARELAKYKVDITVVDKNADVSFGEVKGSLGLIYSSFGLANANSLVLKSAATPGLALSELFHRDSLKTKLTLEGFSVFPIVAEQLDVRFRLCRELVLGLDEADFRTLHVVEELCKHMDVEVDHLDGDAIQALEPNINKRIVRGLTQYGDQGQIYPWEYTIALAENAKDNGVRIKLLTEVKGITPLGGGFIVNTTSGKIKTRFIINAAGPYSDKIAEMAGVRDFSLILSKSIGLVTDRNLNGLVNHLTGLVFRPGVSRLVRPTLSGNIHIACSSFSYTCTDEEDTSTNREWVNQDLARAQELFPTISRRDIISSYGAVRVFNTRDPENHLLEVSKGNPNFLNAVTRMPGMGFTPAMAKYMVDLLADKGLELIEKPYFNPRRKRIPKVSELPDEERRRVIAEDPRFGHIVCRCEEVSEGEIVEAIRRGARTIAGVKFRTRAGMGRCQGGFCGPRVLEILARELDIPMNEVTEKGGLSRVLLYRSKELLGLAE
jgi:glycerol-3-phosphate dehydrogenase